MSKQAKIILFSCLYIIGILASFTNIWFGIFALITICLVQLIKRVFSAKYFISILFILVAGFTNTHLNTNYDDDLTPYTENNVILNAKVISIPSNSIENRTKFFVSANSLEFEDEIYKNLNAKTLVTINDSQDKIQKIKIGDTLQMKGRLKAPIKATNPSQFDYAKYLQVKDTFSLLYVDANWEILSHATDFNGKLIRKLNDTRNNILSIHRQNIESPMIEILGGIIFGDDAVNPDEETKTSFIKSGIFHILAASGMNVTLIFGIWFFFAKTLRFNYKFSISMGILLILVYTCMTGFGAPIIRAFLMLTLILIGKLIDKNTSTLSLLFIVGFLMLVYNPLMIYDIGFQLSFLVTFALIITAPLIKFNSKHKAINYTLGACMIPIIAQFYAAPLQMFYFNTFSLYSIFANIAIIPVLSLVSFLGFISSILALIPVWANKICLVADLILNPFLVYIVKVADFFASLPFSTITIQKPLIIQLILYFAIILLLTFKQNKKIIITFIILFALTFIPNIKNNAEIIFFNIGNADAALIKSPQNKYFIIDTGKLPYKTSASQADYIIIKYLKDNGIKEIEGIIISHFDADHAGGTIDILQNLKVNNLYVSDSYEDTQLSNAIMEYTKENNVKTTIITETINILDENNFKITLTKPNSQTLIDENEKSIIALVENNTNKVLFMGDANTNTYKLLPVEFKENITIMKSGHHGAANTINKEMIDNTKTFVISTGQNIYGHPSNNTIDLLESNQKEFYRTDFHNAIKATLENNKAEISVFSPKKNFFTNSL